MDWEVECAVEPQNEVVQPDGVLDIEELKQLDNEALEAYLLNRCKRKSDLQETAK